MKRRVFLMAASLALAGCAGSCVTGKEDILMALERAGPNTAVFFWPGSFSMGLERMAFYQNDTYIGGLGRGQLPVIPLQDGPNVFDVSWQEAIELPVSRKMYFRADPKRPHYYVLAEGYNILSRSRSFEEATKQEMIQEIEASYQQANGSQ